MRLLQPFFNNCRYIWSESSLSAWRKLWSLDTHWAHSEDWSDCADAKADLSLRSAHSHFVSFFMMWLKYYFMTLGLRWSKKKFSPSPNSSMCWSQYFNVKILLFSFLSVIILTFFEGTGRGSSIGSEFAWHASGPRVRSPRPAHSFVEICHENISTAILPLPLIQEEQLSVTGERMCTKYW